MNEIQSKRIENMISTLNTCDHILDKVSEKLYLNGFSNLKIGSKKRKMIFKPIIVLTFLSFLIIRETISLTLNDRNISRIIGVFCFNWRLKSMWNLFIILIIFCVLSA